MANNVETLDIHPNDGFKVCELYHPEAPHYLCFLHGSPLFAAEICPTCNRVVVRWGFWTTALWALFYGWRWRGAIIVTEQEIATPYGHA